MSTTTKAIPRESGLPYIGHLLPFMRNCNELFDRMVAKHGPIYTNKYAGNNVIHLMSPDANEFVLLDREKNFSSRLAWSFSLKKLFPNGLMLRDGDDHRYHRRLLGAPFKAKTLKTYVDIMSPKIESTVDSWGRIDNFLFYQAIKELTLNIASSIFIGESLDEQADQVNEAFVALVEASVVLVRYPMLGNKYQRGLEARAFLENYFRTRIPKKLASDDTDMFAEICRVQKEEGDSFSNQDIVDHIIFLMMAAHDTSTSSLSSVCYALSRNPEWQNKLRAQINAIDEEHLSYEDLGQFSTAELVLKESLRLYPPLPVIPRMAIKDCEFDGYKILANQSVMVSPYATQRDPNIWTNPNSFDPERFTKERAEDQKHKHAWIPFGGGAHKCLGLHFADLQIKVVLFKLLKRYQISVAPGYEMPYQPAPIGKPIDLLPLTLTAI